ncbi:Hypothetical protein A7982_05217 [Minicystis rosea]|nr:Hypothetical protein A7982_05217 [Minicystis rosea]
MPVARHLLFASLLLASCSPAPLANAPAPTPVAKAPAVDLCRSAPPLVREHRGLLRHARCETEVQETMRTVSAELGKPCNHCHARKQEVPESEDYPAKTPTKEIADWMSAHLMTAIKPADGSPLHCRSCHTDEHGRPIAKILGSPRDPVKVNEWMSLVMVRRFVAADGTKLRCRSCHEGTPGTASFRPKVILQSEQLPNHIAGSKDTSAF